MVDADPLFAKEDKPTGGTQWPAHLKSLPFIEAEGHLPHVNLPSKLEDLIKQCWHSGAISPNAPRNGPVTIGKPVHIWMQQEGIGSYEEYAKHLNPIRPGYQSTQPHLSDAFPEDWKRIMDLKRVNAYTFRGDRRGPQQIEAAGGFHPPLTRTDQHYVDTTIFPTFRDYMKKRFNQNIEKDVFDRAYNRTVALPEERQVFNNFFFWSSMVDKEAYHVGRMLSCEALKAYISTSRAVSVAKGYARAKGWVYLMLVQGGFLVPDKGAHEWTKEYGEQEVAFPGSIPWSSVFAFRQLGFLSTKFAGPIYVRKGFENRNPKAYKQAYELLSGQAQGQ